MKVSAIVAMTRSRVIGKDNRLPWRLPEDLKRFRAITMGHPIIMGRKTFESVGRLLPGRENIIITRQADYRVVGAHVVLSISEALDYCRAKYQDSGGGEEVFIIGGAEIYSLALPEIERIYLTLIQQEVEGDAFFPELSWEQFKETSREERQEPVPHSFIVLDRQY